MKYRKRPVVIEATQWNKYGDHTAVDPYTPTWTEGPLCSICQEHKHLHGWIDTIEGGHIVCPGDYIITGIRGEHYPCKPSIFHETYEPFTED